MTKAVVAAPVAQILRVGPQAGTHLCQAAGPACNHVSDECRDDGCRKRGACRIATAPALRHIKVHTRGGEFHLWAAVGRAEPAQAGINGGDTNHELGGRRQGATGQIVRPDRCDHHSPGRRGGFQHDAQNVVVGAGEGHVDQPHVTGQQIVQRPCDAFNARPLRPQPAGEDRDREQLSPLREAREIAARVFADHQRRNAGAMGGTDRPFARIKQGMGPNLCPCQRRVVGVYRAVDHPDPDGSGQTAPVCRAGRHKRRRIGARGELCKFVDVVIGRIHVRRCGIQGRVDRGNLSAPWVFEDQHLQPHAAQTLGPQEPRANLRKRIYGRLCLPRGADDHNFRVSAAAHGDNGATRFAARAGARATVHLRRCCTFYTARTGCWVFICVRSTAGRKHTLPLPLIMPVGAFTFRLLPPVAAGAAAIAAGAISIGAVAISADSDAVTNSPASAIAIATSTVTVATSSTSAITAATRAAGAISVTTSAIAVTTRAAGAVTATASSAGAITIAASPTGAIAVTASATGTITVVTRAAGAIAVTASATGTITVVTRAAGAISVTTRAAGAITVATCASGTISVTARAASAVTVTTSPAGTITVTTSPAGAITIAASSASAISIATSSTGAVTATASSTGAIAATASSTGAISVTTSAASPIARTASAIPTRTAAVVTPTDGDAGENHKGFFTRKLCGRSRRAKQQKRP